MRKIIHVVGARPNFMKISPLMKEIDKSNYIFAIGDNDVNNNFKLVYSKTVPIEGINDNKIKNENIVCNILRENIYLIEKKFNLIFKETILILNNFDYTLINFTGYKKLNGSQLTKENITYILNSLKSKIDEIEDQKKILHIFNSKFVLDKREVENLPIGLFGDFYSHELSFFLIKNNDYKNLNYIFSKCNLGIKKIISKSFIEGVSVGRINKNLNTLQ